MKLNDRISKLESVINPEQLPKIEIVFVDCACQVKNPEKFKKVLEDSDQNIYGLDRLIQILNVLATWQTINCFS